MSTTETLQMLISKLPSDAREAHRTPGLLNNLIAASKLVDAGCELFSTELAVTSPETARSSSEGGGMNPHACGGCHYYHKEAITSSQMMPT